MDIDVREVLIAGLSSFFHDRAAVLLPAPEFNLRFTPDASSAAEIIQKNRFHVVLVEYGGDRTAIRELARNLRWSGSLCRSATAVLLCSSDELDEAEEFLYSGFSRILNPEAPDTVLGKALDEVLHHEPRYPVRALVRITGEGLGHAGVIMTQTANLSTTGMLVLFDKEVYIGSRFDFVLELPGLSKSIRGTASVVRLTLGKAERVGGFAARFSHFEDDDRLLLMRFLAAQRTPTRSVAGRLE